MEYLFYNTELGWDNEKDEPIKVYSYDKKPSDPDPKKIFDADEGRKVKVKRWYGGGAPAGFVH